MKIFVDIAELFICNVGINLGGGDVGVAVCVFLFNIYGIIQIINQ